MVIGMSPLSIYVVNMSINLRAANYVEYFLRNPYWLILNNLFSVKYVFICRKITFSNSFEIAVRRDICL